MSSDAAGRSKVGQALPPANRPQAGVERHQSESALTKASILLPDDFRRACGRFATGVAVAAAMDPSGVPHGLTVSSVASVFSRRPCCSFPLATAPRFFPFFAPPAASD